MLGRLGPQELLIIFGVALLIFGPTRIPQVGRGLGKAFKEYRGVEKEIKDNIDSTINDTKDTVEKTVNEKE